MAAGGQTMAAAEVFSTQLLSLDNVLDLLNSVVALFFDLDGVIWKGDAFIDGAPNLTHASFHGEEAFFFITNGSTNTRKQYANKIHSLDIPSVTQEEIFCSSFAAAMFLKINHFPLHKKGDGAKTVQLKPDTLFEHDKSVGAVVVGRDQYINYYKIQYATLCIRENAGCIFIATNCDAVGGGCMVAAVCGSTQREPFVVGKLSTFMMDFLAQNTFNISASRMCMVGDNLGTDILFGHNAGCRTLLVLSGVTTQSGLEDPENSIQPEFYSSKVSDLLNLMKT